MKFPSPTKKKNSDTREKEQNNTVVLCWKVITTQVINFVDYIYQLLKTTIIKVCKRSCYWLKSFFIPQQEINHIVFLTLIKLTFCIFLKTNLLRQWFFLNSLKEKVT